jgi:hypothetical protein
LKSERWFLEVRGRENLILVGPFSSLAIVLQS